MRWIRYAKWVCCFVVFIYASTEVVDALNTKDHGIDHQYDHAEPTAVSSVETENKRVPAQAPPQIVDSQDQHAAVVEETAADTKLAMQTLEALSGEQSVRRYQQPVINIPQASNPATYLRNFRANVPVAVVGDDAESKARQFLNRFGAAFLNRINPSLIDTSFAVTRVVENDQLGMSHVHFEQLLDDVPVSGAYVSVHMNDAGVKSVQSNLAATIDNDLSVTPDISKEQALTVARSLIAKFYNGHETKVFYRTPRLEVFNRGLLLDGEASEQSRLTWYVEVRGFAVREAIWVDAHSGTLVFNFSQLTESKNRSTYDSLFRDDLRVQLRRTESSAATGDSQIDNAHTFAGHAYDYFASRHGRDSYDGNGATIHSNVRYGPANLGNAFWNGTDMAFGLNYATDDIVVHEFTHAVTEFSAGLIYYGQSGALNESFSDIFGEVVDLQNNAQTDTNQVRWLIGEDSGGGALRNMSNPNQFGDPARTSDRNYWCSAGDNNGVHINSGVPNYAFVLMSDGGSYNGYNVASIGMDRAAKIHYRALTTYLGPSSRFPDHYDALIASCDDLVGVDGITTNTCAQVKNALDAVEMDGVNTCQSQSSLPAVAGMCPVGQEAHFVLQDDFEDINSTRWITRTLAGQNVFNGCSGTSSIYCQSSQANSGQYSLHGRDPSALGDSVVEMSSAVQLNDNMRVLFSHHVDIEPDYDGAVVEYSTNGGASWIDAGPLFIAGEDYHLNIVNAEGVPLAGREAFSGYIGRDYVQTQMSLDTVSGSQFQLRFRAASDSFLGGNGWRIDDVSIYQCLDVGGDDDADGVDNQVDNCPLISNADQANLDGDSEGDVCDSDIDNDGVDNTLDAFPRDPNESVDSDLDGIGNNADPDDDNDNRLDGDDNCPLVHNPDQEDSDNDGQGDVCDAVDDNEFCFVLVTQQGNAVTLCL